MRGIRSKSTPRWVGAYAERVVAVRGRPGRLKRVFDRSSVPMVMVDPNRRYIHANAAARLFFRKTLDELRRLRIDDLTPIELRPAMERAWARLSQSGCLAGLYELASPRGTSATVAYYAMTNALPSLCLIAFAPAGWTGEELLGDSDLAAPGRIPPLTQRELEVLELAADGHSAPMIAEELVLSPATVRTHFSNIYEKLEVRDRAAAVAKAMRLGRII